MTIEIWLGLALLVSMVANVVLIWFSKEQSQKLSYVSQNLGDLVEMILNYKEHLRKVYSLEMFYGDETLKFLMDHTNALVYLLEQEYGDISGITEPLEYDLNEELDEKENEENEESKVKDVLYAGTRRRDS
jgi:hypothetical protein